MSLRICTTCTLLLSLAACGTPANSGVANRGATGEPRADESNPWETRLELAPPSEDLMRLSELVGEWDVVLEDLSQGAGAAREVARGSATIRTSLGGRYLAWDTSFELADRVVSAHGRLGFDESHDVFQFLWLSELAPGMRIASGRGDAHRGGLVLEISERDPDTGALLRARTVLKIEDADHFSLSQLGLDPLEGDWLPQQRTLYVRRTSSTAAQEASGQG